MGRTTTTGWQLVAIASAITLASCVNPPPPMAPHPPAPDRYQLAADPNPAKRITATEELIFDPSPQAPQLLTIMMTRDVDPEVRARAAEALARRRDPTYDSSIEAAALAEQDPGTRARKEVAYEKLWAWRKRPGTAAGLALLPGGGHFYLRQPISGAAYLLGTVGLLGTAAALIEGEVALDGTATSATQPVGIVLGVAAQNLWFYSIFDAYRDARVLRDDAGYKIKITRESLGDLTLASFDPRVLKSPWVWGAVPVMVGIGLGFSYLVDKEAFDNAKTIRDVSKINVLGRQFNRGTGFLAGSAYFMSLFAPVGVGEEALFRGVIQTEMEERFGTTWGLVVSSAIFGAVHTFNFLQNDPKTALVAVPLISVVGSALGLAYQRTDYKLKTSVAMHFWYDTLLSMAAFALDPEHQPFVVTYNAL
jgi:membrane protease YdiL (CAAX protease family)